MVSFSCSMHCLDNKKRIAHYSIEHDCFSDLKFSCIWLKPVKATTEQSIQLQEGSDLRFLAAQEIHHLDEQSRPL